MITRLLLKVSLLINITLVAYILFFDKAYNKVMILINELKQAKKTVESFQSLTNSAKEIKNLDIGLKNVGLNKADNKNSTLKDYNSAFDFVNKYKASFDEKK